MVMFCEGRDYEEKDETLTQVMHNDNSGVESIDLI